jgi:catechol 2,3-dioxygenase-like lactoylglutathione lyase family enzyme
MSFSPALTAILPCNDLDASEAFYSRLGFVRRQGDDRYRVLIDSKGRMVHLTAAVTGWLVPGKNPFGLYLYTEEVDALAEACGDLLRKPPEDKPWGMYEFAVSDPDQTLVRVGWPTRLRAKA